MPQNQKKNKYDRLLLQFFPSQNRMTTKKTKTKQYKVFTSVGAIDIRLIEMKTKAKRFCLTIFLFVVLLSDICFIVRYMFFCTVFDRHIRMKTKQISKKGVFRLPCIGVR